MKRIIIFLWAFFCIAEVEAQDKHKTINLTPPRPKVGVVLSGGGAKGAAHIGVLKYIEEIGLPIDYVVGTSMGSIIGGLYAMGYSPDELAQLIADMNWSQYVGNSIDRSAMSEEVRKRNSTMLINIPFSFNGILNKKEANDAVSFLPSAYVNNTSLINLFNDLCVGYQKDMDFNELPIPFACVATDIKTGKEVDIRYGSVPTAMRASMAIPGVFSPVSMDGHLLVDGGLVNNFPADVLEEMGADIIIGVDVSDRDTIQDGEILSLPEVLNGLVDNAVNNKREANQTKCNLYLCPDITGYGTLSFSHDAIDTLVKRGYQKAMEFREPLMRIKQHLELTNEAPLTKRLRASKARNLADAPVYVNSIVLNQTNHQKSLWLLKKGRLKINEFLSEKDINHAIDIYRGTGAFDDITYNLTENGIDTISGIAQETYTLSMNFKPTHPHVFGLGIRYDTEEGAALLLNFGINDKLFSGFKLSLNGKLSYNPKFNVTGTYSSLNLGNFSLAYDYRNEHYKAMLFSKSNSNLQYSQHKISAYVSPFYLINFSNVIGVSYTATLFDRLTPLDFSNDTIDQALISSSNFQNNYLLSPYIKVSYDNRDLSYFAKHGINTTLKFLVHFDLKGKAKTAPEISYSFLGFLTPNNGRYTIIPQVYARCIFGSPTFSNLWNIAGGEIASRHFDQQFPFIGIRHADYVNDLAAVLRCDLRYRLFEKHYITAIYNFLYGSNLFGENHSITEDNIYSGIGLQYAYNSIIGPISLTAQWSDCTKQFSAYFSIGYLF